jgi:hypothetical protein|nr:MAG TPA: hypothetical protein [Caudoviricetes sp.]
MTKTFKQVIDGIRTAVLGKEVREDIAQMGEYCQKFTEDAGKQADAAKQAMAAIGLSVVDGALCMTYDDGTTTAGVPESEE